jgi:hypothetical protein
MQTLQQLLLIVCSQWLLIVATLAWFNAIARGVGGLFSFVV